MTIKHFHSAFVSRPLQMLLFLALFVTACSDKGPDDTSSHETHSGEKVLLVSVDGLMNEYLDRNDTPNFDAFIESGVRVEYLIPVFPTKTFPNHWTIATGLYVENHGILSNSFYDYELDARFSYGPQNSPNDERWWGGEPIWITAEKQGRVSATFFWPGSEASIHGVQSTRWVDYDGSVPDRARIDSMAVWMDPAGEVDADFGTLYFSFVDSRGHTYGSESEEVDEAVREMDRLLGYMMEKMEEHGILELLNIVLLSDHGMADLSEERIIFLEDLIDLAEVDILDWSPVALIQPDEGKAEEVYQALKRGEENYKVYLREDLPREYRFTNHPRIPEIIMIADVGYTITTRPFFEERGIIAATHGYDHRAPEMRSFFAATGPSFKSGETVQGFQSVHIYNLLAHLLGIDPAENDGDPALIRELLN